ncbi:MAG: hypothetical protein ABI039_04445 [Vicinamibacterales bacterium]
MLLNDVLDLLMNVPPLLAGAWAAWFTIGLMLSIWQRRDKARLVEFGPTARHRSGVRASSNVSPPSGVRAPRPVKGRTPAPGGDAFSELEALLESPAGMHRTPGDGPRLPGPQSLP